jgi:hypothetical protein
MPKKHKKMFCRIHDIILSIFSRTECKFQPNNSETRKTVVISIYCQSEARIVALHMTMFQVKQQTETPIIPKHNSSFQDKKRKI